MATASYKPAAGSKGHWLLRSCSEEKITIKIKKQNKNIDTGGEAAFSDTWNVEAIYPQTDYELTFIKKSGYFLLSNRALLIFRANQLANWYYTIHAALVQSDDIYMSYHERGYYLFVYFNTSFK